MRFFNSTDMTVTSSDMTRALLYYFVSIIAFPCIIKLLSYCCPPPCRHDPNDSDSDDDNDIEELEKGELSYQQERKEIW